MEYAIIEASGRQFWIEPKKFIEFNRLLINIGSRILLRRIIFINRIGSINVGQPYLPTALIIGSTY